MNYKRQIMILFIFMFHGSIIAMDNVVEILLWQKLEEEASRTPQRKSHLDDIPEELKEKLDQRYLNHLPSRAEEILIKRQGFFPALFCFGIASCLTRPEEKCSSSLCIEKKEHY